MPVYRPPRLLWPDEEQGPEVPPLVGEPDISNVWPSDLQFGAPEVPVVSTPGNAPGGNWQGPLLPPPAEEPAWRAPQPGSSNYPAWEAPRRSLPEQLADSGLGRAVGAVGKEWGRALIDPRSKAAEELVTGPVRAFTEPLTTEESLNAPSPEYAAEVNKSPLMRASLRAQGGDPYSPLNAAMGGGLAMIPAVEGEGVLGGIRAAAAGAGEAAGKRALGTGLRAMGGEEAAALGREEFTVEEALAKYKALPYGPERDAAADELHAAVTRSTRPADEVKGAESLAEGTLPAEASGGSGLKHATVQDALAAYSREQPSDEQLFIRWDERSLRSGDSLPPSREWMNGDPTTGTLSGTSALDPGYERFSRGDLHTAYMGDPYLVSGRVVGKGEDAGEVLLTDARVVKRLGAAEGGAGKPPTGLPDTGMGATGASPPIEPQRQYPVSVSEKLGQGGEPFPTYTVLTNKETYATATRLIEADRPGILLQALDPNGPLDAANLQAGMILERQAHDAGDMALFHQINEALARKATALGQAVQIYSTMGLSPELLMNVVERRLQAAVAKGGPETAAAISKRMAAADDALVKATAEAESRRIVTEAETKLAEATKRIAALERKPVLRNALLHELDLLFGSEVGAVRLSADKMTFEAAEAIRARAQIIKAMEDPTERAAAIKALRDEVAHAPEVKAPAAAKVAGLSQRERDLAYLTDDTVRDVLPKPISSEREVITKAKALLKQSGAEMDDVAADTFLSDAAELADLPRQERVQRVQEMVAEVRGSPEVKRGLAEGAPLRMTPEREAILLQKQAADIEKLVFSEARQSFQRLQSVERLAMARVQGLLRRTGAALTPADAEAFTTAASALRQRPLAEQPEALDALVNSIREKPDIKAALNKLRVDMDMEAAARRDTKQLASDIERLTTPYTPAGKPQPPEDRKVLRDVVSLLRKAGVQLSPEEAATLRANAKALASGQLTPELAKDARQALVQQVRESDPVAKALAAKAADAAAKVRAAKELEDLKVLTGQLVPEAKIRAKNVEREMLNRARQTVAQNGLALPEDLARSMRKNAEEIAALPDGQQKDRRYQAFIQDVKNLLPPSKWGEALDLYGLPRALKSTWDASFMLRQGALLGFRHPDTWLKTWGPMLKSFRDPFYAEQIMDQLATRPLANLAHESGLAFDEIWKGNEFFGSAVGRRIPMIAGSERAFVVPGNKIRGEGFDSVIRDWLPRGYDLNAHPINSIAEAATATGKPKQHFKDLALLYNALSGKSTLKLLQGDVGKVLNLAFWAPQWTLSIPEAVGRTAFSPGARKEGARVLASYFGFVAGAEVLGDLTGVWDAELDPRSSNFGKVRIKGTMQWYDPTLGMGFLLRTVAQMLPTPGPNGWASYHKTAAGALQTQPAYAPLGRFLRGKLQPVPGEFWNWFEGQNIVGEKRSLTGTAHVTMPGIGQSFDAPQAVISVANTAKSLFSPLTPQDIVEGVLDDGLLGGVLSLPNVAGMSGQSYSTFNDAQQKATYALFPGKQFGELDRGQQWQVNDSPEIKLEFAKFSQPGVDIHAKVRERYDDFKTKSKELEVGTPATATRPAQPGLRDYIEAGMRGKALRERVQAFKQNKYRLAQDLLSEDVLAATSSDKEHPLHDVYAQLWANVPLEEDLKTGELDYDKRDNARAAILLQAQDALKAAGRDSTYITGRAEDSYRGKQADDPVVRATLDRYDAAQEILKSYWDTPKTLASIHAMEVKPLLDLHDAIEQASQERPTGQAATDPWVLAAFKAANERMGNVGAISNANLPRVFEESEGWRNWQHAVSVQRIMLGWDEGGRPKNDIGKAMMEWYPDRVPLAVAKAG